MMEQMTIWDYMDSNLDDLAECMRHPTIEGGKIRIFALYKHEKDSRKRAQFLKDEYGLGGRSYTLKNGENGFVDYEGSKGIKIYSFRSEYEQRYKWSDADKRIEKMIQNGQYMTDKDMEKWESMSSKPYPIPCYRYPPEEIDDDDEWEWDEDT